MAQYCIVLYHSPRWAELVEQGWVTMYAVDYAEGGKAQNVKMVYSPANK